MFQFAEYNPLMDEILEFAVVGTVFWSLLRIDSKIDASIARKHAAARRNNENNRSA